MIAFSDHTHLSIDAVIAAVGVIFAAAIPSVLALRHAKDAARTSKRVEKQVETNGTKATLGQLIEADHFILHDHVRKGSEAHDFQREEETHDLRPE